MSQPASIFFQATDTLSLVGWTIQTGGEPTDTEQNAVALGADGDKAAENGFDPKKEISLSYVATAANAAIPSVGDIKGGYHIDSVTVNLNNNDFAKMTVTAHKHGSSAHDTPSHKYDPTVGTVGGFGCPTTFGPFALGTTAGVGVKSITYTLQTNHVDELKEDGSHLAGDNYDGTEQVTVETTGPFTFSTSVGWHKDSSGQNKSNTAATTSTATYTKHLAHYVAQSGGAT